MRQWDCDQLLNGLLKALQIVSEQLVGDRLGDLLAFVNVRPVMAKSDREILLALEFVCGQLTAFKELNEFLALLAGCSWSSSG